ncbi:MAG: MFS transporter [Alphaproteobacteria bacterium]|nr:MFS transporter [Alphaproteobacteria bacterium]
MAEPASGARVGRTTKFAYGFGAVAFGVKDLGFAYFLMIFYNQVLGLPASAAGLALMIALLFDAVSDPIVGYASDNLRSRWGRRHPFMYAAALPIAVAFFFLWNPPGGVHALDSLGQSGLFAYLLGMAILVRILITFYEIPSTALVSELTSDYDERTTLLSYRFFFGYVGSLVLTFVTFSVFLKSTPAHPSGILNPAGYMPYAIASALVMLVTILVSSVGTHSEIPRLRAAPARKFEWRNTLKELGETFASRSFLALFVAALFSMMAQGVQTSLALYFATFYWELTSEDVRFYQPVQIASATAALLIAPIIAKRFDKKRAAILLSVVSLTFGPLPLFLRLLGFFPENDSSWLLPILLSHQFFESTIFISASIIISSMVADLVEEGERRTGRRSEGVYFAARTFAQKTVTGFGVFVSGIILDLVAFPATAKPGAVDDGVLMRLVLFYAPVFVLFHAAAALMLLGYRISRQSHAQDVFHLEDDVRAPPSGSSS